MSKSLKKSGFFQDEKLLSQENNENTVEKAVVLAGIQYRLENTKNMWRKVGGCGKFRKESGGSGYVHG
ncbi:hypothetical protein HHO41_03800 [Bacillus sp. DNRA2]|uniref:hypothetical protein n=1 Tax=Bacillus sp. DNRA2 TaxID=2723053 RepID=UPI00145DFE46|nr:hypothetical protein [Bacillus sp. DNRA2]NMD69400.1 hypothetical protein [Bacillus sp. DNRA2]